MSDVLVDTRDEFLVEETEAATVLIQTEAGEALVLTETDSELLEVMGQEVFAEVSEPALEVLDATESTELLETAEQGPPGPPGQAGVSYLTFTASGPIGGHRAVVPAGAGTVGYADNTNLTHANAVVGITLDAAADGAPVNVQTSGEITEPGWNWSPLLPVFLGANGLLTQVPPETGFQLIVGMPAAPQTLVVGIKQPFVLGA